MTVSVPFDFPVLSILDLLQDLPTILVNKHRIAVNAWKNLCDMIRDNQAGMLLILLKTVWALIMSVHSNCRCWYVRCNTKWQRRDHVLSVLLIHHVVLSVTLLYIDPMDHYSTCSEETVQDEKMQQEHSEYEDEDEDDNSNDGNSSEDDENSGSEYQRKINGPNPLERDVYTYRYRGADTPSVHPKTTRTTCCRNGINTTRLAPLPSNSKYNPIIPLYNSQCISHREVPSKQWTRRSTYQKKNQKITR